MECAKVTLLFIYTHNQYVLKKPYLSFLSLSVLTALAIAWGRAAYNFLIG